MKSQASVPGAEKSIQVHDYMVAYQIGSGAFARIHIAFHYRSRNPFAVKIISKKKLQESKYGKLLKFNETILARVVDHPAIIDVCEICDSHSQIFQFMRFAEHGDLRRQLAKSRLSIAQITRIIDQVLAAVEYLHSFGICHRDIKLENILLSKHSGVKLSDFGLAAMTFDGIVHNNCGSFQYAAPEAIHAPSFDGMKADMWSIGVVCYALFACALPFPNVHKDFDYEAAEVNYDVIPEKFRPLIQQLLSIDPAGRPSATEARGFHALNSSQTRRKEPLSALAQPIVIEEALPIVTRLSQMIAMPVPDIMRNLTASEMNREKVLYLLLARRFKGGSLDVAFKGPIHQRSEPSKDLLAGQEDGLVRTEFFRTTAVEVYSAMHSFLMKERCCVSLPISSTLIICRRNNTKDLRVLFNIFDRKEGDCAVTLIPEADSVELSELVMSYLIEKFRAPEQAVC